MSPPKLTVRAVHQRVGIGQRWRRRHDGQVIVVYQVHRAERRVEAHLDGSDPTAGRSRFLLAFAELAAGYELLNDRHTRREVA